MTAAWTLDRGSGPPDDPALRPPHRRWPFRRAAVRLLALAACRGRDTQGEYEPDVLEPDVRLPALRVDGPRIVDRAGAAVVLRGIALSDPDQVDRNGHWDAEYFHQGDRWAEAEGMYVILDWHGMGPCRSSTPCGRPA